MKKIKKVNLLIIFSFFSISLFGQNEIKTEKTYFENGKVKSEVNYEEKGEKKIREGKSTFWYDTGELKLVTHYKKNKLNGERVSYWKNGEIKRADLFKKGKFKKGKCFDINGNEVAYYDFEIPPEFPGGKKAFDNFIMEHLIANSSDIKGVLIFSFTIEANGKTSNLEILKDTIPSLKDKVVNMFYSMPTWKPAKQDGNPVEVKRTLPVVFE